MSPLDRIIQQLRAWREQISVNVNVNYDPVLIDLLDRAINALEAYREHPGEFIPGTDEEPQPPAE